MRVETMILENAYKSIDLMGNLQMGEDGIGMCQYEGHGGRGGTLSRSDSVARSTCPALRWYDMCDLGAEDTEVSCCSFSLVQNPDLAPRGFLLPPSPPPLRSPPLPSRLAVPACLPAWVCGWVGGGGWLSAVS